VLSKELDVYMTSLFNFLDVFTDGL